MMGPIRQCIVCRRRLPKRELWRLSRESGTWEFFAGDVYREGRGAYFCGAVGCRGLGLRRGLRAKGITIDAESVPALFAQIGDLD